MSDQANRRIDHIRDPSVLEAIGELPLDELRQRRDACLAEREYLSLLRRLVQGRAEILKAEVER
ncbi:MAG: RsiG family protein, partial [Actinomycetota bacterium]